MIDDCSPPKKEDLKALCIENAETDDSKNSRTSAASQAIKYQGNFKDAIQEKIQFKIYRFTVQDTFAHIQKKKPKMLDELQHKLLSFKYMTAMSLHLSLSA